MVTPPTIKGALPVLVTVSVWGALVTITVWLPKLAVAGDMTAFAPGSGVFMSDWTSATPSARL